MFHTPFWFHHEQIGQTPECFTRLSDSTMGSGTKLTPECFTHQIQLALKGHTSWPAHTPLSCVQSQVCFCVHLFILSSVPFKVRSVSAFTSSFFHSRSGLFPCSTLHSFISLIQGQVSFCVHSFISLSFNPESQVCFCVTSIPSKFTSKVISVSVAFSPQQTLPQTSMRSLLPWQQFWPDNLFTLETSDLSIHTWSSTSVM